MLSAIITKPKIRTTLAKFLTNPQPVETIIFSGPVKEMAKKFPPATQVSKSRDTFKIKSGIVINKLKITIKRASARLSPMSVIKLKALTASASKSAEVRKGKNKPAKTRRLKKIIIDLGKDIFFKKFIFTCVLVNVIIIITLIKFLVN